MEVNPLNHKIADVYIYLAFIQLGIENRSKLPLNNMNGSIVHDSIGRESSVNL